LCPPPTVARRRRRVDRVGVLAAHDLGPSSDLDIREWVFTPRPLFPTLFSCSDWKNLAAHHQVGDGDVEWATPHEPARLDRDAALDTAWVVLGVQDLQVADAAQGMSFRTAYDRDSADPNTPLQVSRRNRTAMRVYRQHTICAGHSGYRIIHLIHKHHTTCCTGQSAERRAQGEWETAPSTPCTDIGGWVGHHTGKRRNRPHT